MAKSGNTSRMRRVEQATVILKALGLPKQQWNERSALTLLALADIGPRTAWARARQPLLRTVDMMTFMRDRYGKAYAPNSRETIRRYTLHQFIEARVADLNPDDPSRPTNSGLNRYAISDAALEVLRRFGTTEFEATAERFREQHGDLAEEYRRRRGMIRVPVTLPDGRVVRLSPGPHNTLQKGIIEDFAPRFAPGATVLYLGDTAQKDLICEEAALAQLAIQITEHDKLPDIVLYRADRHWLYLIEAVTSHGPMTPTRLRQLARLARKTTAGLIYVTAFLDKGDFRRHVAEIAWETEVWIASDPDHLIHFNGHRFLGPQQTSP